MVLYPKAFQNCDKMFQDYVRKVSTILNFPALLYIFNFFTGKLFCFSITLIFIIFSNRDRINFIIIFFLFVTSNCSAIDPVISFSLEMLSCYFKMLKLLVILIWILNNPHIRYRCLFLPLHKIKEGICHCSIHQLTLFSDKY